MTNAERYKTAKERAEAFYRENNMRRGMYVEARRVLDWLDLEAEAEKPLPCPYCGGACVVTCGKLYKELWQVVCLNDICGYSSRLLSKENAIATHNRFAEAAKAKGGTE